MAPVLTNAVPSNLDRKTRAMHLLDQQLGEAMGKLYVARFFPPEAKAKADLPGLQSAAEGL